MMNSNCSSSESEERTPSRIRTKKQKRVQKYRKEWESIAEFTGWLQPHESPHKALCKICKMSIKSELYVIKHHAESRKHKALVNCSSGKSQSFLKNFIQNKKHNLEDDVHSAEIRLCSFFAEHNISFNSADHLTLLLKDIFNDSKIAQNIKLGRTKMTAIIKNVVPPVHKGQLSEIIKSRKFSILTDESTDVGCEKTSCIVVRYFDEKNSKIQSSFWDLIQVYMVGNEDGATAENLYNNIINSFKEFNVPLENVVGFGSDGCNVMMGSNNSVSSRFHHSCPGIKIMKCVCHSAHLCASEACKMLPRRCENLSRNIYNHFKSSAKRVCIFKEFQIFLNLEMHKMLHPSQTRWLSVKLLVDRILEQWDALKLYFTNTFLGDRLISSEQIFQDLHDPSTKLYFLFLQWALPKFTIFNQYFQSDKVVVTNLNEKVTELYKEFLLCFMDRNYVMKTPLNDIKPSESTYHIPLENLYLGVSVLNELNNPDLKSNTSLKKDFLSRCQQFLITACIEIKKRFNFDDEYLKLLSMLSPNNAMSSNFRQSSPSLYQLIKQFPRIIPENDLNSYQLIDDEWRKLAVAKIPDEIKNESEVDRFWSKLMVFKNILDKPEYFNLANFALNALCIPHSNAECERVFSKINLIKTKTRNRLVTTTIKGTLLTADHVKKNGNCIKFKPNKEMIKNMNQSIYAFKQFDPEPECLDFTIEED